MLYSASTGGFYSREIHSENIPVDAIDESQWEYSYAQLMSGQSEGKMISHDPDGCPTLVDYPGPSAEEILAAKTAEEMAWRNDMLRKVVDGLDQIRNDAEFGSSTYKGQYSAQQLNGARVLLCHYPESEGFPFGPRPTMPE